MKKQKSAATKSDKSSKLIVFTIIVSALVLTALMIFGLLKDNDIINSDTFSNNSKINGINVSGMKREDAASMISNKMIKDKDDVEIILNYGDKNWRLNGKDFQTNSNLFPVVEQAYMSARSGTAAQKLSSIKKNQNLDYSISYRYILGDFDKKVDDIAKEVNCEPIEPKICFDPQKEGQEMFSICEGQKGCVLDKEKLYETIDNEFAKGTKISVEIPVKQVDFTTTNEELLANTKLRSSFSTSYASSAAGRKNNVKRALADFNGMSVAPNEEISFNDITGDKTPEKGYMKANIILNGIYVEDYGGGACQASTTLYNALILSDVEILEVHPHSMPVSYVPLAFDAMVSEGYSDLRFKNTTGSAIYIKTYGDETNAYVEIYGAPLEEGLEIKRRAEFIETIPHDGDIIMKDEKGEYSDKITYEGEYLRIKKPQEGYHSKAYIDYYQNGELAYEKLIRDEIYQPQRGIIMEGTEPLGEGMTLPENNVEIIPPQSKPTTNEISLKRKLDIENPANLNP